MNRTQERVWHAWDTLTMPLDWITLVSYDTFSRAVDKFDNSVARGILKGTRFLHNIAMDVGNYNTLAEKRSGEPALEFNMLKFDDADFKENLIGALTTLAEAVGYTYLARHGASACLLIPFATNIVALNTATKLFTGLSKYAHTSCHSYSPLELSESREMLDNQRRAGYCDPVLATYARIIGLFKPHNV